MRRLAFLATLLAAFAVALPSALACSLCAGPGAAAPIDGSIIPADVTTLWVDLPLWANIPARIVLSGEQGAPHPMHLTDYPGRPGQHLVVLDQPLRAGVRYTLSHPMLERDCQQTVIDARETFSVVAAGARPSSAGSLSVAATSRGPVDVWTSAGSCFATIGAAIAQLRYQPAPEAAPYLPIDEVTLKVDGQTWATAAAGSLDGSGKQVASRYPWSRRIDRVFAHCPNVKVDAFAVPPDDTGVAPGAHRLELFVHRVGDPPGSDPAPATADVTLSCDDASLPLPVPSEDGCACRVAPERTAAMPWGAMVLGAMVLALLRRRRAPVLR